MPQSNLLSTLIENRFYKLIIILSVLSVAPAVAAKENREACDIQCASQYGKVIGTTKNGIKAYSNCNNDCVIFEPNTYNGTYTGIKWQCVEFARRWLLARHGVVYGDVDFAIDIWDKIQFFSTPDKTQKIPVSSHVNGSEVAPRVGDLFIYAKALYGTGHVAVVIGMDAQKQTIRLGEQNYKNVIWPGGHAREVDYVIKNGQYWVHDAYLIGWKHADFDKISKH